LRVGLVVKRKISEIYPAHNNFDQVALETRIPTAVAFDRMMGVLMLMAAKMALRPRERFLPTLSILGCKNWHDRHWPEQLNLKSVTDARCY